MKGSAVYNRRYPFIFRLLRGNPAIRKQVSAMNNVYSPTARLRRAAALLA